MPVSAFLVWFGTLLLSQFVALLAALQLADHFGAPERLTMVILILLLFCFVAIVTFAFAHAGARRVGILDLVAVSLAALAATPAAVQSLADAVVARSLRLDGSDVHLTLELLLPALIAVLVQWGLVRRRYLQQRGDDDLSPWPWVTTIAAGLAVLNPVSLDLLGAAAARSRFEGFAGLPRDVALALLAIIVMTAIECYIRGRMLRRRLGAPA
jgi:hypothetical protein